MFLQGPGGVSPREMFLLGPAAQPRVVLTLAAAREGLGSIFLSAPSKLLENLKLHPMGQETLPDILISKRDELMAL